MPLDKDDAAKLIARRHSEWTEHQKRWRWLLDSYEGGERYRHADYKWGPFDAPRMPWYQMGAGWLGTSGIRYGEVVERNLVPHISETTPEGKDDYSLRLQRTPIPKLLDFVVRRYLSRIYSEGIDRKGPASLVAWWDDVDGQGTAIGDWMRHTVAPLLLVLGQLDLVFGRPRLDEDVVVATRADQRRLGLDRVEAGYILPENLAWWSLDRSGRYREVLVFERREDEPDEPFWRHWTAEESNLYAHNGDWVAAESFAHSFGRVPIVRVFDERKVRCRNVGQPRFEEAAERQKSVYNRESELALGDVVQSHAVLQGPEDYCGPDRKLAVGPGGMLPKKKSPDGDSYEGFEYIAPPQMGVIETRVHMQDDVDATLRSAYMLKPAGMVANSTTAQSGLSKMADLFEGSAVLAEAAQALRQAERVAAEFALVVAGDGRLDPADLDAVEVTYPVEFNLQSVEDLAAGLAELQAIVAQAGELPETESEGIARLITQLYVGLPKERLDELHREVTERIAAKATERDQAREGLGAGASAASNPIDPESDDSPEEPLNVS